jgi:ribosome-associated protein
MIEVTSSIKIDESEIEIDFIRASGPGGQNVNKLSTAAQLRFDITGSANLPDEVKARLIKLTGSRVTENGVLLIDAKRYRTQDANRQDAIKRLVAWIQKAAMPPKVRHATRPSGVSRANRMREKRKKSEIKQLRKTDINDWEN